MSRRQYFTCEDAGTSWELEFSADGKTRFVEANAEQEQEFPPWIESYEEALRIAAEEPWRVRCVPPIVATESL